MQEFEEATNEASVFGAVPRRTFSHVESALLGVDLCAVCGSESGATRSTQFLRCVGCAEAFHYFCAGMWKMNEKKTFFCNFFFFCISSKMSFLDLNCLNSLHSVHNGAV